MEDDWTYVGLRARASRRRALLASIAVEVRELDAADRRLKERAVTLLFAGQPITGRPRRWSNVRRRDAIRIGPSITTIEIWTTDGEGNAGIDDRIKFPTDWLARDPAEWPGLIAKAHAAGLHRQEERARARKEQQEETERASLRALLAKYGNPS